MAPPDCLLLLEPNPTLARYEGGLLRGALNCNIHFSRDWRELDDAIEKSEPTLVVLSLSQASEIERITELKQKPAAAALPVVVLGHDPALREQALGSGADEFLSRPFRRDEFLTRVRVHLRRRRLARRAEITQSLEPSSESAMVRLLVETGVVNREDLDRCLFIQKEEAESGNVIELADVLLREGVLKQKRLEAVSQFDEGATSDMGSDENLWGRARSVFRRAFGQPKFGGYEIIEETARGGMGIVYKARQKGLGRIVSLKVLHLPEAPETKAYREEGYLRFQREAQTIASLRHPNIVTVYDVGQVGNVPYYTMAHIEGTSLLDGVKNKQVSQLKTVEVLAQIAEAVEHCHANRILHRDIKPSNILLDGKTKPYLIDFGIAKVFGAETQLTTSGQLMGSPFYLPPEYVSGSKDYGVSADVYALGVSLFWCLSGRYPHTGDDPGQVFHNVVHQPTPLLHEIVQGIAPELSLLAARSIHKDPAQRFSSAVAMAEALWSYAAAVENRPEEKR